MSIERITPDNFEHFTLVTNPSYKYSSSSSGLTGSIFVYPRRSSVEKESVPVDILTRSDFNEGTYLDFARQRALLLSSQNIRSEVEDYLVRVRDQSQSERKQSKIDLFRFEPSFKFTSNTIKKHLIKDQLMSFHRTTFPEYNFNYSNYHCLNFYTASNVPPSSALLYPNPRRSTGSNQSQYGSVGPLSFDFWIKPKYTTDKNDIDEGVYKPGVIFHLTSSYAVSLHSSSLDENGFVDKYKVAVQFGSGSDISPNQLTGDDPSNNIFFSTNANEIEKNRWSHITIRYPGPDFNNGSGSIMINEKLDKRFQSNVKNIAFYTGSQSPSVLVIGNYYEGTNQNVNALNRFFAADTAEREGLKELNTGTGIFAPDNFQFTHPLNAEVHDLKIYDEYINDSKMRNLATDGDSIKSSGLRFYVPPFFTYESPKRKEVNALGGILQTPFFTKNGETHTPFAANMAFSVGGHYINLENYVRDFKTGNYARLWELTGSKVNPSNTQTRTANQFLYATGSNIKRLYTVLPCDNGKFDPNFDLLKPLSGSRFVDDKGGLQQGAISLRTIVPSFVKSRTISVSGTLRNDAVGANEDDIKRTPGISLSILHNTRDSDSNQIQMFDISNLMYGDRIKPGSFAVKDTSISESDSKFGFGLRDNKRGSLYRSDTKGKKASWSSVGNIFYDEGLVVIKHPQLFFFGKNQFDVEFSGTQEVHTFTVNALAKPFKQVTSSNPSFIPQNANDLANETDQKFVYITNVNLHDEDLNVVARTKLSQYIQKKSGDRLLFRIKKDF